MTRAFGYLRLSHDRDTSTSIEKQRASVEAYCADRSWELVECFEDVDVSGRKESRPGLDAMLSRLEETDVIVFHRLDRIMRSVLGFAKLLERCQAASVELVSATEPFDTSTAMGRMLVWLLAAIAEIEAENTRSRILATRQYLATRGIPGYDPRAFGRRQDPITGEWVLVEDEAHVLRDVAERYLAGAGLQALCTGLNDGSLYGSVVPPLRGGLWHPTALSRMLQSPRMLGYTIRHGKPMTDEPTYPPILDVETFEAVGAELRRRRTFGERHGQSNGELTGLVRCATCKGRMYINSTAGKRGYTCRNRAGHSARIPKDFLEEEVARRLFAWIDDRRMAHAQQEPVEEDDGDRELRASLARLEWGRDELMRDYYQEARVERDVFEVQLAEISDRIERVQDKLAAADATTRRAVDRIILQAEHVVEEWPTMSHEEKRVIFAACVRRVVVKPADFKGQKPSSRRVEVDFVEL